MAGFLEEPTALEKKFLEVCTPVVTEQGLDLYELEYISGSQLLRLYVENPETKSANLEDCVKVDRAMTEVVEENSWMPDALVLEVSSPGVYRNITTIEHMKRALGERIMIGLGQKVNLEDAPKKYKSTKKLIGILKDLSEDSIKLELEDFEANIELENIKKASIEPEWDSIKSGN